MELTANVAIGILTNAIYDIAKYAGSKFFNSLKYKDKDLKALVKSTIIKNLPDELYRIFESSTFISYFDSPQFLDVVNAYLEHKIICNYTAENARIQRYIKKSGIITAKDVVSYISRSIHDLYKKNNVISSASISETQHAVEYILSTTEEVIAKLLSKETKQLAYLLNSRMDKGQDQIITLLAKLQSMVNQIQQKEFLPRNDSYEEIKAKYHAILKEKNSDAHIYLLDKFPFDKFYVPPILQSSHMKYPKLDEDGSEVAVYMHGKYRYSYKNVATSWKNVFENNNIIYLTGGAGYGKSLFTKKIINDYLDLDLFHSSEYIVIFGEFKSFFPNGSDTALSVAEFLKESIKASTLIDVSIDFIEHYLYSGRCIILLDALDEVEKSKRVALHESVVAFFKNQNPNNKICITSRDRGFIPERDVEVLTICPLNKEQIEKYVDKIIALKKFEKADKGLFMKQTEVLVRKGFLNSFLVLSLLINIYKAERELPENKLELYQKCFEYIANKREKDKTQKEFDWRIISPIMKDNTFIELSKMGLPNNSDIDKKDIKENLLQLYRTKYGSEADTENAIDEFLKFCSDRTELFVPTAEDKYKFFHRSFFEYFYSLYIFLRCSDAVEMLEEFAKFDVDSEVFELTVAMLKQKSEKKYQALIDLLFSKSENELIQNIGDFNSFNILILSMQVIDDVLYKNKFLDIIVNEKDTILKNTDRIHNLNLVSVIFEDDKDAYVKICDAYRDECLLFLFKKCDLVIELLEKYSNEKQHRFAEDSVEVVKFTQIERYVFHSYSNNNIDKIFYVPILSKAWNCAEVLIGIEEETVLTIYKKHCPKNYKKKATRTMKSLDQLRKYTDEKRAQLIDSIFAVALIDIDKLV